MKSTESALRGEKAKLALDNEVISQAFDEVERGLIEAWKEIDPHEDKTLLLLKMKWEGLKSVKEKLAYYIGTGKAAAAQLQQEKTK